MSDKNDTGKMTKPSPHNNSRLPEISDAVQACGRPEFQALLSHSLAAFLNADTCGVLQYSRHSIPHYLVRENVPEEEISLYLSGVYRFDPFLRYWKDTGTTGLISLAELENTNARVRDNLLDYTVRFQPKTGMADEIALLMPKIGGAVDNFFFLRQTRFTHDELEAVQMVGDIIKALNKLNQNLLLKSLMDGNSSSAGFPESDAFMIEDSAAHPTYASSDWVEMVTSNDGISKAAEKARQADPGTLVTVADGHIVSEALGDDFPLAPQGRITFFIRRPIARPSLDFEEVLENLFSDQLTPREYSICRLALQGHPTVTIGDRLGITVGTVKNHRKRIYRKLDITTERELFLLILNYIVSGSNP